MFAAVAVCTVAASPQVVQGIQRLPLRVDPDVRVVLQHPARQMTADRFEHVIGHAHLGQLGDDRVPKIVEPQAVEARLVTQRSPGRVPLQHRLRRVEASPLARRPEIVLRLRVPELVRALEHARGCFDGRCVERDDPMARLVLASPDVHEAFDEIDVAPAQVLHFDRSHRGVRRDDRGAVHVLPFRVRRGGVEEPLAFLPGQGAADGMLALRQVVDMVRERSPATARLQHARQHADVHVDRAVRDAGLVPRPLEVRDRSCRDRRQGHVAEVAL